MFHCGITFKHTSFSSEGGGVVGWWITARISQHSQRGEGCAWDSVDFCPFLKIIKISLYLHTISIAKPPKNIIYREKIIVKTYFFKFLSQRTPPERCRWLGRWIEPPANGTSLERDSHGRTKNSARMSSRFKRRSNDVLESKYSASISRGFDWNLCWCLWKSFKISILNERVRIPSVSLRDLLTFFYIKKHAGFIRSPSFGRPKTWVL